MAFSVINDKGQIEVTVNGCLDCLFKVFDNDNMNFECSLMSETNSGETILTDCPLPRTIIVNVKLHGFRKLEIQDRKIKSIEEA